MKLMMLNVCVKCRIFSEAGGRFVKSAAAPLLVVALHGASKDHLEQLRDGSSISAGYCRWVDRYGTAAILLKRISVVVLELLDQLLDVVGLRFATRLWKRMLYCRFAA